MRRAILDCRLDRTTDLMSSYAAPASELANAGGVQGAQATEKHMRHKIRCASKPAAENKRAQAGEAMAGGAADWNNGGPVAVWPVDEGGVFGRWIVDT